MASRGSYYFGEKKKKKKRYLQEKAMKQIDSQAFALPGVEIVGKGGKKNR